jgi:choline dehydrogenase
VFAEHNRGFLHPPSELVQDEALIDWMKKRAETVYHPVGTCKMGDDDLSVVNSSLQVHGIQGLRVADASIMPNIVSGNTNAPCIAIGSKCASILTKE